MPCLILKTNQSMNQEDELLFCQSASEKIAHLLNKPESYVMVLIETQLSISMSGTTAPTAYAELKSINLPEQQTTELSNELCAFISQKLDITPGRIYIEFSNAQRHLWGWDSKTF
ncbi:MAG: hypothetical protein GY694_08570 [Gammaproteobacteria bacterium]|nr:hypothetical protein [Gammaproteobacteria bacterium]